MEMQQNGEPVIDIHVQPEEYLDQIGLDIIQSKVVPNDEVEKLKEIWSRPSSLGEKYGDKIETATKAICNGNGLDIIKSRVIPNDEIERLNQIWSKPSSLGVKYDDKVETDARSIYVGNVDYGATAEQLIEHFHGCGFIKRVAIQCDKYSGHSKGFAYIEFTDKDSVTTSAALDESLFRGRQIKVMPKRTNTPGISTTDRRPSRFRRTARKPYFRGRAPIQRSISNIASVYVNRELSCPC